MHNIPLDDNFHQWCNGNYELVYSSLRQLRRYSKKVDPNVPIDDDSYKQGFFHRFWNKCTRRQSLKEESPELKDSESDQEVSESEDEDLEELRDPTNDLKLRSSLQSLKTAIVECMTRCNFQRPRLIPKRRYGIRKDQLLYHIRNKFEDLVDNLDQIEEYSLVCNVDQLLCAELLYEGLFYYGVKDSQTIPEFTIIENMLFREAYFQLRTIRLLFSFINRGEFRTTPTFEVDKVFPEAIDIVKHLADRGLARNLFLLLITATNETHKFYRLRGKRVDKTQKEDAENGFGEKPDYDLVFRHNALYLNTLLDVLTSYYMTFSPTQVDFGYIMAFLSHVFDKVKMFGIQESANNMRILFENQPSDDYSAYYPRDARTSPSWVTPKEFDRTCEGNLTCKLCNLFLVMLNTNIYRIDCNLNMVRTQEGFIHIFMITPHCLFFRGEFDETYDPNFRLSDVKHPEEQESKYTEKNKLELERFEKGELKELEETREYYKQMEVVMDFVMYGSYKNDESKIVEGFSNDVVEVFLEYMERFQENREKLETNYLKVYKKIVKLIFKPLLTRDENLNKNWFNLLNFELSCKTKLEALAKVEVHEEVNTAIFRDPGTSIIDLLNLFTKVFGERDAEFLFKVYKSISESYNSLMPSKPSMLFTQTKKKYNKHYFKINTRAESLKENALKHGEYNEYKKTKLYQQLKKESQEDNITLKGKERDHLLLFPNKGFTWMERNAALLEMVNFACGSRKIFVETYPRLLIQLLEFSLHLSKFPKIASRLGSFLNSASSRELQVPSLLKRVVNQLKCLNKGDFELLPALIYEHIVARDDKIEKVETALEIATTVTNEGYQNQKVKAPNFENTSEYLQEYFKKKTGLYYPEEFKEGYGERWIGLQPKREYLKDVDNYRINVKQEDWEGEELYRKPEQRKYIRRMYTFPLINTTNDVKKALSNLGLGSGLPFGLVEVASTIFRLVLMLDPLVPETRGLVTKENRRRLENRGSQLVKAKVESRLLVNVEGYKYLDVLFSILSNQFVKGTEKLVGSLLKSIASVHVTDHKVCKMSLSKVSELLYEPSSTLGRKLTYYELSSLMYCITVLLMYLPYNLRYRNDEASESDYLLDLLKYILNILEREASTFIEEKKNKKKETVKTLMESSEGSETDYYTMMDNIFSFLLILSKGPLGLDKTSRATQYLYEQILLPGSSVAYLLVKCANESKMTTAVSLACNVFKRDFLVHSLHKISKFNLNKDKKCPNCRVIVQEELRRKREENQENGKFIWFLNKIHLIGREREKGPTPGAVRDQCEPEKAEGRVGCEVCCNIDFNQRPLALLQAHEAFMEALSTYSEYLSSEVVGNLSTRNMELRIKTLYLLVQMVNRNCKVFLNNKLLTKFKCYLHQSTFTNNLMEVVPEGARYKDQGLEEEEFYYVINDVEMESSDLVLYNKLKWLTQADYDEKASFANLRELNMCTFKTLVTYFFSIEEDLQTKVVDERMFMNMVKTCKETWEENHWHKVYLMSIVVRLIRKKSYARMLLLTWPSIFEEVQEVSFERNKYNYNLLMYAKMKYQLEAVMNYSRMLNNAYDFVKLEYRPETGTHEDNDREFREKLNSEDEEFMNLVDVKSLNYTMLTFRVVQNFCEYEELLYKNLISRISRIEMSQLVKAWNFHSYSIYNDKMSIKLLSYHSITTNRDAWFESSKETEERELMKKDEELEEYANVVEMYNNYTMSFVSLFKRVLKMYEQLNMLKFETMFDYVEENDLNYEFKFVLNLIIVKRLYKYNDFNLILKVLMKLVNYLLETEETNELMRTKIYHIINYFIKITAEGENGERGLKMTEGGGDKMVLPNLIISHLSNSTKLKNILAVLFEDSNENYEVYHDLDVLGHILVPDKVKTEREEDEYLEWRDATRRGREGDVRYYRYRCIESMYFALEKKDLNCSVEAMKLLSSLLRGLNGFEANRVELDKGRLDYGRVGSVTVESLKNLVNKRVLKNFYLCKDCLLTPPLCKLCSELLVGGLNVLQSVCGLHQFSSFWFSTRVSEQENLSDMFLKSSYLSIFKNKVPTEALLPTMFVIEHLLSTTSIKTRNAIITWLNRYCEMLLVSANVELEEPDEETKLYLCCLLRVYRITFLWLLSDYRSKNEYRDNFSLILADLHCKFPLASTLPRMVQKLLVYFVSHLDSNLNWLLVLLCLQTFFPELGAFEMDLNFTSQVPIKTKAMELVKSLVEVMVKCSKELLKYIEYYSNFNNSYPYKLALTNNKEMRNKALEDYELYYNANLENLNAMLTLKVVTLDCCVILLEYILSLVKIPNTVGINSDMPEMSVSGNLVGLKQENLEEMKRLIEKLAKVCTTNGASLYPKGVSRENTVEYLPPYQLEQVLTFYHQFNYTNKKLFSTLLTSLLNLDSILQFYT